MRFRRRRGAARSARSLWLSALAVGPASGISHLDLAQAALVNVAVMPIALVNSDVIAERVWTGNRPAAAKDLALLSLFPAPPLRKPSSGRRREGPAG